MKEKESSVKKYILLFARILLSILIGFLPSFLYVSLFVQYQTPFVTYLNFLADFSSSLGAWISALAIGVFVFLIWGLIKNFRKIIKNKILLGGLILLVVIILFLISFQLYLYVNFVLGSDILVKLSADKDDIFLTSAPEEVTFKISVIMNPFCSAHCSYRFTDISKGETIEKGEFNITSVLPRSKTYQLEKANLVEGSQVLNRFEVICSSKKSWVCYTKEEENTRSVLVTINYQLTSDEQSIKNNSKENLLLTGKTLSVSNNLLNWSHDYLALINNSFSAAEIQLEFTDLDNSFLKQNNTFYNLKKQWTNQEFFSLEEDSQILLNQTQNDSYIIMSLDFQLLGDIQTYNNLAANLSSLYKEIADIYGSYIPSSLCAEFNQVVSDFNDSVYSFNNETNLSKKEIIVSEISSEVKGFSDKLNSNSEPVGSSVCAKSSVGVYNFNLIPELLMQNFTEEISVEEPTPICCFLGKCGKCCDDNSCSSENYPIIFLHGHSFNKALSADYSFDELAPIKEALSDSGYIDAGTVLLGSSLNQKGLWGKTNASILITASYFFDSYKTADGEMIVQSKLDSIDTYAIRLRNIIDVVKTKTGKDKVVIVAHSMGGLVTRRYAQIFGADSLDKLIFIDVPNHGVEGKVRDYCAILSVESTCDELSKDSLFINQLDNAPELKIPVYNLVGVGCNMGTETGDGIVKNSSQYLSYATNYYFNGTCNELNFEFFHQTILYPLKHPEVYNLIKDIISNREDLPQQNL